MKARLITELQTVRERVLSAEPWLAGNEATGRPEVVARMRRVAALNYETATVADLAAAGDVYPPIHCNGCGNGVWSAVEVGDEPDYESATATLCRECVLEAAKLIQEA